MINFDGVSVEVAGSNEPVTIIHNISLSLSEHRIALIGANGSGKSTLARLINGLVLPSSGTVTVHTQNGSFDTKQQGRQVREEVGFVFTDPSAQLVMPTAIEDVSLSLRRTTKDKKAREALAFETLAAYGLETRAHQSVHTLSGGQSQLLALASILATKPGVLVADEPTTLLDLKNSILIAKLLLELPQQLIVATHDLELAAKCDRALWIEDGRVAFDGAPSDAIRHYRESV